MDQQHAGAYATHVTDQLGKAVADGDADTANNIVDQVAADGHSQLAADLNLALTRTGLADDGTTEGHR